MAIAVYSLDDYFFTHCEFLLYLMISIFIKLVVLFTSVELSSS